ncbi:22943_t:CDS:2, partial [Racocetra persica]
RLRLEQASIYKSYVSFVSPNCTRWNSHYLYFASIIKSHTALKNLATKIEDEDDNNLNGFSRSILSNISDNEWWKNLIQLKVLLEPYMASLNKLQRDKGCLTEVLHSFRWIVHYYKSWFGKPPYSILYELQYYENEEYPFNKEFFDQFGGNVLQYWNFCKGVAVELHLVAYKKVLAMSQIRSELLRSRNIATIDKLLKTYKQTIAILFEQISSNDNNEDEFILSEENTNNDDIDTEYTGDSDHMEEVKCVDDWKINLTEEKDKHMQSNSSSSDELETDLYDDEDEVMHQDYLIHPADNLGAKWKLTDIFTDSLNQPDSIHLLLGD